MKSIRINFEKSDGAIPPEFYEKIGSISEELGIHISILSPLELDKNQRKHAIEEFKRRASEISNRIGPIDVDSSTFIRKLRGSIE